MKSTLDFPQKLRLLKANFGAHYLPKSKTKLPNAFLLLRQRICNTFSMTKCWVLMHPKVLLQTWWSILSHRFLIQVISSLISTDKCKTWFLSNQALLSSLDKNPSKFLTFPRQFIKNKHRIQTLFTAKSMSHLELE